jgi:hypothetical protein
MRYTGLCTFLLCPVGCTRTSDLLSASDAAVLYLALVDPVALRGNLTYLIFGTPPQNLTTTTTTTVVPGQKQ